MSLQSNDLRREEYHRYLEKSGVMEYFSRVLVSLYELPEKPADPNEFIRQQLSIAFPDDTDYLLREVRMLEERLTMSNLIYNEMVDLNYQYTTQLKTMFDYNVTQEEIDLLFEPDETPEVLAEKAAAAAAQAATAAGLGPEAVAAAAAAASAAVLAECAEKAQAKAAEAAANSPAPDAASPEQSVVVDAQTPVTTTAPQTPAQSSGNTPPSTLK